MGFKLEHNVLNQGVGLVRQDTKKSLLEREIIGFSPTFSNKRKEDFYTELSVLLKAGISLKRWPCTHSRKSEEREAQAFLFGNCG